ncbi:hypothetical protein ACHAPU_010159 [Fusarium lateritium]
MADQAEPPLAASVIHRINDQMVSEIFKLTGKDPKSHEACFSACVKMVESTRVIYATNLTEWINDNPTSIAKALDDFNHSNLTTKTNSFCTVSATTAVTLAAALNQKHIYVDLKPNQRITKECSKIWGYLGVAIDVWPQTEDSQFFVKRDPKGLDKPIVGRIARGKFVVTTSESDEGTTPLMLLSLARLEGWVIPARVPTWLETATVNSQQIIHRRKVLDDGKKILEKLGNRKFKQNDKSFMREMKAWLSEPCNQNNKDWLPIIDGAEEDLSVWKFSGKTDATVATFISNDVDWKDLCMQVRDEVSTGAIRKLVELAGEARKVQNSQKSYLEHAVTSLMEIRKTLIEDKPDHRQSQEIFSSALNQCFLSQDVNGRKNILIGALQRLFDNIVDVVPIHHALCCAFFDLASKVNEAVISSIDLNIDRAKKRHQQRLKLNDELNCRNEVVASVAETITNLGPGSTTPGGILRSRICSILDSADALIIQASLPHEAKVVVRSQASNDDPDQ